MGLSVAHTRKQSNPRRVKIDGKTRNDCRWFAPVLQELQSLFPKKLPQELAHRAERSVRVCEKWIAKQGAPDGAAMRNLIESDIGDRIVLALTKNSEQRWVRQYRRLHESAQLQRQLAETQRRLDRLRQEVFE